MRLKIRKAYLLSLACLALVFGCAENEDEKPPLIDFMGVKVQHTFDVPVNFLQDPKVRESFRINLEEEFIQKSSSVSNGSITYSLDQLADIAEAEAAPLPNNSRSLSANMVIIRQNFLFMTDQEIYDSWDIVEAYYDGVLEYEVGQRSSEMTPTIAGPGFLGVNPNNTGDARPLDQRSNSVGFGSLSICELGYLLYKPWVAIAARKASNDAKAYAVQHYGARTIGTRHDVMLHTGGAFLLGYHLSDQFLRGDINRVYNKAWAYLHFREEMNCNVADDYLNEQDHRSNLNGLEHWRQTASVQNFLWIPSKIVSRNKQDALNFLRVGKTDVAVKVAKTAQAVWNVNNWTCVYFDD